MVRTLRIGLTSGHSEWLYDHAKILRDICGFEVKIVGGLSDHKRPQMEGFEVLHKDSHEVIEHWIVEWEKRYGHEEVRYFEGDKDVPRLYDWLCEHDVKGHINRIADEVDCFVHLHPKYASTYCKAKPGFWQLHGGEHRGYWPAVREVQSGGGQVVCYSKANAVQFAGRLPIIRFGKDPEELKGWTGERRNVLYLANKLAERAGACHLEWFKRTRIEGAWTLAGSGNEQFGISASEFNYPDLLECYRQSRLFFNLGTSPAPYTLGVIEAALVGCPIATPEYYHRAPSPYYEVPGLFGEGCKIIEGRRGVERLLDDYNECKRMSQIVREKAIEHFDWKESGRRWKALIHKHMKNK